MIKRALFVVTIVFCNTMLHAQNSNLAPAIALATELKAKFKDAEAVCIKSDNELSFKYDRSKSCYSAILTCSEEYIFLKKDFDFRLPVFYDEFSEIVNEKAFATYAYITDEFGHSAEIFHDDTRYKLFKIHVNSFGQKLEIQYEKVYNDLHYLSSFYLAGNKYPYLERKIKVNIQNGAYVDIIEKNFENNKIDKNTSTDSRSGSKINTYTIKNAEAFLSEDHMPHVSQIYPHILFLVKKMEFQKGKPEKYFETTDDLYQWYNNLVKKVHTDKDRTTLLPVVEDLTKGKTDIEKMKSIYYWVQDKIRYIAFENGISGYMPDSAFVVFNKKYGDCKGMANLLVQMLKIAGFDAHCTWIGTKGISYDYSTPALLINNHMICTVYYKDNIYFLDATEKCSAFGEIAERIQGRDALIENGEKYVIKKTPIVKNESNTILKKTTLKIADLKLEGHSSIVFSGESRADILHKLNYTKSSSIKENINDYLTDKNPNFTVTDVKYSPLNNYESNFDLSYDFSISNRVQNFSNEYYVNFDFYEECIDGIIDTSRKYDYILDFKEHITHETELLIPDLYTVSYTPENVNIENEDFNIQITFIKAGNKIQYKKIISFPTSKISKKNFGVWNKSVKTLRDFYNNQLVLKK